TFGSSVFTLGGDVSVTSGGGGYFGGGGNTHGTADGGAGDGVIRARTAFLSRPRAAEKLVGLSAVHSGGRAVTSTGAASQYYGGPVTLGVYNETVIDAGDADVEFADTVDSAADTHLGLTVIGRVKTFGGAVGSQSALSFLFVDGSVVVTPS